MAQDARTSEANDARHHPAHSATSSTKGHRQRLAQQFPLSCAHRGLGTRSASHGLPLRRVMWLITLHTAP
eukprot:13050712-Alexandrium_andersonii.AAC.1